MCRLYEDQMNESKAKVEELQRQLNDTSTQRARAQAESGKHCSPHYKSHNRFHRLVINTGTFLSSWCSRAGKEAGGARVHGVSAAEGQELIQPERGGAQEAAGGGK